MALINCQNKVGCMCSVCHQQRLHIFSSNNPPIPVLLQSFNTYKRRESRVLDSLLEQTLNLAALGKCIREKIMTDSEYSYPKSYFRHIYRCIPDSEEKEKFLKKLANSINHAAQVWEDLALIYNNFMQTRYPVDIRQLTIENLWRAREIDWCHSYAERVNDRKRKKPDILDYSEDQYRTLLKNSANDPCIRCHEGGKKRVASVIRRLERDLLKLTGN